MRQFFPGLILSLVLGLLAIGVSVLPFPPFTLLSGAHPIDSVMAAIFIGLVLNMLWTPSKAFEPGIQKSSHLLLPISIVLLGARFDLRQLMEVPYSALGLILFCIFLTFVAFYIFSKIFKLNKQMGVLLGFGTAICGSAAIVAIKPILNASKQDTTVAITIVNLLGVLAIFLFPLFGHFLQLSDVAYGLWAGTSIQAVAQVVGAGFGYSVAAGLYATLIKLVRVLMLAPCVMVLSMMQGKDAQSSGFSLSRYCPPFIIMFYILVLVSSTGILEPIKPALAFLSNFLMTIALAAIGLESSIKHLLEAGKKPLLVASVGMLVLVLVSLYFSLIIS